MTKAWLLNTLPTHWDHCVQGPNGSNHPAKHHNKPWHGIPDSQGALNPTELNEGDLLIVRVNGEGVKAVWTFEAPRQVTDQSILPDKWRDHEGEIRNYKWILYCNGTPVREFENSLKERFNDSPNVHQGALAGTAKKAKTIVDPYIEFLLEHDIPEEAKKALREASSKTGSSSRDSVSRGAPWERDEYLVTLDLYLNESNFVEDKSDPKVQAVASDIGRTPSAVALRLANYRALDERSTKGMTNISQGCQDIWDEYHGNEEELAFAAEGARERLGASTTRTVDTGESLTTGKSRHGQTDFRDAVRKRYDDQCLLCGISDPGILQAGHILDWSEFEEYRGDPANGILLCYNHHRAFDLNMFTLTDDYELIVRPGFSPSSEFLQTTVIERTGETVSFPSDPPSTEYLHKHNERLPWSTSGEE